MNARPSEFLLGARVKIAPLLLLCLFLLPILVACSQTAQSPVAPPTVAPGLGQSESGLAQGLESATEADGALAAPSLNVAELNAELVAELAQKEALWGGKVIVGITQEPDFLDPYLAVAAGTKEILFNLFEGLLRLTPAGELECCLAESYSFSPDGLRLDFVLRPNVFFHNGQELTARDVIWSLEQAAGLQTGTPLLPELAQLSKVEQGEAANTVSVYLKEANADILTGLCCAIVPADYEEQNSKPVGTGPFRFASYTPQEELLLERFPEYWEEGKPYLDAVSFRIYGSMDAAYLQLLSGAIDVFPYLTASKAQSLGPDFYLSEGSANMVQLLAFNNSSGPLQDEKVRRALCLALNKKELKRLIMDDHATILTSAMSPAMGKWCQSELSLEQKPEGDPVAARQLLAETAYKDGLKLTLKVPANYTIHVDTANVVATQLKQIGVELEIEPVDWGTWLDKVYLNRAYELTIIALTFEYSPSDVLDRYCSTATDNFINYKNPAYDELAAKARSEQDSLKRQELYHEMQSLLYRDSASCFLQDPMNLTALRSCLAGYHQYPAYVQDLASVYFVDQAELDASKGR